MFPCRGKSAVQQANELVDSVYQSYGMIWIDVEINPSSGCSWYSYSSSSNCDFVLELIDALEARGKKVGIYSSMYQWEESLGSNYACPEAAKVPIWYAHYDNRQTFSDFSSFGGWSYPDIKQYVGDTSLCSVGVDLDYY